MGLFETVERLNFQYVQVTKWSSSLHEKLYECTPNEKQNIYKQIYMLDMFQSDLIKLQTLIHERIQISSPDFLTDQHMEIPSTFKNIPAHLVARPSVVHQLTTMPQSLPDNKNNNYYSPLALSDNGTKMSPTSTIMTDTPHVSTRATATASSPAQAAKTHPTPVNAISLKELGAIIEEFTIDNTDTMDDDASTNHTSIDTRHTISTYNCTASSADRNTLAQEQERSLMPECTIAIKGLHPQDTQVRLTTNINTSVTIKSLLLSLPITSCNTSLFHGRDQQHNTSTPSILAKYPDQHPEELITASPSMDLAIKIRSHTEVKSKTIIKWIMAQNPHLQAFPPENSKRCHNWKHVPIKCFIQIGPQTWAWRNTQVHGKTIQDTTLNEQERTLQQVKNIYLDPPSLLCHYPAVHEVSSEVRTNQTTRKLLAWKCHLEQQIKIAQAALHRNSKILFNSQISRRICAIPIFAT
jgi:chorismate mutase